MPKSKSPPPQKTKPNKKQASIPKTLTFASLPTFYNHPPNTSTDSWKKTKVTKVQIRACHHLSF